MPFGASFVEAKNIRTIAAPDLDVAVVRSAPLIECFENIDSVPIEMKSPRHQHSVIRWMLFDLNAHDLGPSWSGRPTLLNDSVRMTTKNRSWAKSFQGSRSRVTAIAPPKEEKPPSGQNGEKRPNSLKSRCSRPLPAPFHTVGDALTLAWTDAIAAV